MSSPISPGKFYSLENISMLDEAEPQVVCEEQGSEGESPRGGCGSFFQTGSVQDLLVLLLKVTQLDGRPFSICILTAHAVVQCIVDITGKSPIDIEVLTNCEVVVQMEPAETVVSVAEEFHNVHVWDGCAAEIMCLVSIQKHVLEITHEQEDAQHQARQIEQETRRFQQEQKESQEQLADLLQKFGEEVRKVEKLKTQVDEKRPGMPVKKEMSDASFMTEPIHNSPKRPGYEETKISESPQICVFSGNEPVPKDGGNFDQWEFQVWGAMATHTENSVWVAIMNSLLGPAWDLVGFVGSGRNFKIIYIGCFLKVLVC